MKKFFLEEAGQDIVEYSLLLVLIAIAVLAILTSTGTAISSLFNRMNSQLNNLAQPEGTPIP